MPPSFSDHSPVYLCLKVEKPKMKAYKRVITKTNHVDWDKVNSELEATDWSDVFAQPNINDMITTWQAKYLSVIHEHVQVKEITVRPADPAWFTPELRKLIRKKNRAHKLAKRHNTEHKWQKFRKLRADVVDLTRKAKQDHMDKLSKKIHNQKETSPKVWWKLVKDFYGATSAKKQLLKPLIVDNKILTSDLDKANALNNFFSQQCTLEVDDVDLPEIELQPQGGLCMINITATTVKDLLDILNTTKSSGPDDVKSPKNILLNLKHTCTHL